MVEFVPRIEDTKLERNSRNGRWEVRWTEPAAGGRVSRTRAVSCSTKDRALAEAFRRDYLSASSANVRAFGSPTIGSLIELYLLHHVEANKIGQTTVDSLKPIKAFFGALEASMLAGPNFVLYRAARRGVVSGTQRRELGSLRAVLSWAWKNEYLPKDFIIPHVPLPQESAPREVFLTAAQEADVHDRAAINFRLDGLTTPLGRVGLFVLIGLNAPARSVAIETLTWDRVDLTQQTIDFRDPNLRVTKKRRGFMPISDRLLPILDDAWSASKTPFVLGTPGTTRKPFDAFMASLGLDHIVRHDMRRTWGTLAAQRGVSLFDIAGTLGDTMATAEKHYAVHAPGYLRSAINTR